MTSVLDPYEQARRIIQPDFPNTKFHVFVLGPALKPTEELLKPTEPPIDHESIVTHARFLRYLTKKGLSSLGYPVDFGEAEDIKEFWQSQFHATDPGSVELLHASKFCGAIIVFPSSVGSISELGLFTPVEKIAEKTLAVVHKAFENDASFFRKALLEVFVQEKGRREFIDYSDHDNCVKLAIEFVNGKYQKLLRDLMKINAGKEIEAKLHGSIFQG
jgi:hypothetical protein